MSERILRLTLHQFRCWDHLTIEVPIGGITLIKGSSGGGKTTLLQAITWCLYGNLRLVAPNHLEKAKTRVMLELPFVLNQHLGQLTIDRSKNPNRLLVSHTKPDGSSSGIYEDKVAQSILNDLFGSFDVWLASCYIGQGCRNSFLTAPNTGKMELLNNIAFHEEDPSTYIERIDAKISDIDSTYKDKLASFTARLTQFQTLHSGVNTTKALSAEQTTSVQQKIISLTQDQVRCTQLLQQRQIDLGMLHRLRSQLDTVIVPVISIDPEIASLQNKYLEGSMETVIDSISKIIPLLQRRDDLQAEIEFYSSSTVSSDIIYTPSDYQEAVSKETMYRDQSRLATNLGITYSSPAIQERLEVLQQVINSQERLKLEAERDQMLTSLRTLEAEPSLPELVFPEIVSTEIPVPDYSEYSTSSLSQQITELSTQSGAIQTHIRHLQQGLDVIQCPHCFGSTRYQQGKLVPAETGPVDQNEIGAAQSQLQSVTDQIRKLQAEINLFTQAETQARSNYERAVMMEQARIQRLKDQTQQLELEQERRKMMLQHRSLQIQSLQTQIEESNQRLQSLPPAVGRLLTATERDQTHAQIGQLKSIHVVELPSVSSASIQVYLKQQEEVEKRNLAMAKYEDHVKTIPDFLRSESTKEIRMYLDKLRGYSMQMRSQMEEQTRLEQLKQSLQQQMQNITVTPDPTSDLDRIQRELAELQQALVDSEKARTTIEYHGQLIKEREEVVAWNANLADWHVFRQHAVETECRILQQVVDSINQSIEGVCTTLFDRDINITLGLFKTLKTTKTVKPTVNFSIAYQGGTFDTISQMSGGEGDRASLALTLALNRLSSCPILMLDESLSSLDLNMKEAAIRTIREHTDHTVLIILHDGIEGIFHSIIDIDEFQRSRY